MSDRTERRRQAKKIQKDVRKALKTRACEECTACCVVMGVKEIDKATNQPCKHLSKEGRGCEIYFERPSSCRQWNCLWRMGAFEEEDRPDKLGLVFDVTSKAPNIWPGPTYQAMLARELYDGAFEDNHEFLTRVAKDKLIVLVPANGARRVIGPEALVLYVRERMPRYLPMV